MRRNIYIKDIWIVALMLFVLFACSSQSGVPSVDNLLVATPVQAIGSCEACAQATLASALTQEKNNTDTQAAGAAKVVRANAQATFDSANTTLSAVQTQDQNKTNALAAQIAATAEIVRANAQATLNSAGITQNAALTQDVIRQTQAADRATTDAQSLLLQQSKDEFAVGTQTAIANNIATQTQAAAATSQWYADRDRQRQEQRQGPIAFLWVWCFPIFILLLAGLVLWGFWRWLRIQQSNQRILVSPIDQIPAHVSEVVDHHHNDSLPYLDIDVADNGYQVTTPDDQVHRWLDEVKDTLRDNDKKDEDNDAGN
jgi:hypothetical protein